MKLKAAIGSKGMVAAALMLLLAGCGSAEDRAKEYYKSGMEYLDQQDYAKAAIEFRNALKLTEDYADAWYGMAIIEQQSQAWPRFYADLTKVLEINPKHVKALIAISTLQVLGGDLKAALKNAGTAAEIEPDNPDIIAHKASVLFKLGDKEGALRETRRALQLNPNHPGANIVAASEKLQSGDAKGAVAVVEAALRANPNDMALNLMLLSALEKTGDMVKTEAAIRALVKAFPEQLEFRRGLVDYLIASQRSDDAEKELRTLQAAKPDDTDAGMELVKFIYRTKGADAARGELVKLAATGKNPFPYQMALADFDFSAGRTEESEVMLRDIAKAEGVSDNGMAALLKLSSQLISRKKLAEAKTVIADVLKNDGENADALSQRGQIKIEESNYEGAIEDIRAALNKNSKDFKSLGLLAIAYERNGQMELAGKSLDDATKLSNYEPSVAVGYANFLIRRGREDSAEDLLQEVARRAPGSRDALVTLADLLQRRGNWQGAEEIAQKLRDQNQTGNDADKILGRSLMQQKRFDEAISLFTKSSSKSPNDLASMRSLLQAYIAAGKIDEALAFLTAFLQANPGNTDAMLMQGSLHMKKGEFDKAKQLFETAVAKDPEAFGGYMSLAEFYSYQKDMDASIKALTQGIAAAKVKGGLRFALATRYEAVGKIDEAINIYETIVAESPGALLAVNNLASLLTDNRSDKESLDRAVKLAGMLRNSPVPAFRETLGWALVRNGQLKEGLSLLERAIPDLAKVPAAQFHLGNAYTQAGDKELAATHLKLALELETSPAAKGKIEAALKALEAPPPPQ